MEDEECVASGLSAGTDYDFRVRAIPSDTDRYLTSDWSAVEETSTGGTPPPEPTDPGAIGGGGALEITWSSEASDSLVFTWNTDGRARNTRPPRSPRPICLRRIHARTRRSSPGRSTRSSPPPNWLDVRCERTSACGVEDDDSDHLLRLRSGHARPSYTRRTPTVRLTTIDAARNRYVTTRLNWTGINVVEDFDFEMRLVADPGREDDINNAADDDDVQAACGDGSFLVQRTATRTIAISHAVTSGLVPYTGYLLCARHLNGAGSTNWIVPENEAEHHTLPAAPPAPAPDSSRTGAADDDEMFDVAWTVDLQNRPTVPWPKAEFMVSRTLRLTSSSTPKPAACDQPNRRWGCRRNSGRNRLRRGVHPSDGPLGQPLRLCLHPCRGRGRRCGQVGALDDRRSSHHNEEGCHPDGRTGRRGDQRDSDACGPHVRQREPGELVLQGQSGPGQ